MAVLGLGQAFRVTLGDTLVQYYTDSQYRGRVISVLSMSWGLTSLGTFFAALLVEIVGVQWAIGSFAMALILITLLVMTFVARIRKLD